MREFKGDPFWIFNSPVGGAEGHAAAVCFWDETLPVIWKTVSDIGLRPESWPAFAQTALLSVAWHGTAGELERLRPEIRRQHWLDVGLALAKTPGYSREGLYMIENAVAPWRDMICPRVGEMPDLQLALVARIANRLQDYCIGRAMTPMVASQQAQNAYEKIAILMGRIGQLATGLRRGARHLTGT